MRIPMMPRLPAKVVSANGINFGRFCHIQKHSEKLREALNKCQDAVRDLELKLVAERSLRDQDSKKASLQLEKHTMDYRAQIYAIKCEAETWKQKAESTSRETQLLKEQLKVVEVFLYCYCKCIKNVSR